MKIAEEIVYVHDLEGNFLKVNDAITKYTGFSSAELGIGTNLSNYLAPQVFEKVLQEIDDLVCTGGFRILEVPVVVSSGERILFKVGAFLLTDTENVPMAVLGFAKPVEKAEEECRTFDPNILDSLSHELRTPLAGIFGSLKVLEDQLLPDDAKDCVEKCTISAKRLKTAVNKFLASVAKDSGEGHPADLVSGVESVEEIDAEDASGLEILLAEDDMSSQVIMRKLLESWGHSVRTAANGVDVLCHLGEQSYDLVLMDIQMPEMDGHETIRIIRSGEIGSEVVPIVAMSAYSSEEELKKIKALNVSEFISKPIRPEALKSVLDRLFPMGN